MRAVLVTTDLQVVQFLTFKMAIAFPSVLFVFLVNVYMLYAWYTRQTRSLTHWLVREERPPLFFLPRLTLNLL